MTDSKAQIFLVFAGSEADLRLELELIRRRIARPSTGWRGGTQVESPFREG